MAEETPWYTPKESGFVSVGRNLMQPVQESNPRRQEQVHESGGQFTIPQVGNLFTPGLDNHLVGHLAEKGGNMLSEQMGRYTTSYFDFMKPYFDVDQKYVFRKVLRLIYPFGRWTEGPSRPSHNHFGPPSEFLSESSGSKDRMSKPDLYIPTMSFVTFCLMAIASNQTEKASIGEVFTRQIFWLVLTILTEAVILKGGLYFLNAPTNISFMKCISTSSYKYVGMVLILMFSWLIHYFVPTYGSMGYIITGAYFSVCMSVFIVRSVKEVFVDEKQRVRFDQGRSLRTQFLIVFSLVQVPLMFFLSYSYKRGV